jgi:heme exporter protein D
MELLESFVWIAVGFVPMLCVMELASRLEKKVRLKDVTRREMSPDAVLRK